MAPASPLTLEGLAELHRGLAETIAASRQETDRRFQEIARRFEEADRRPQSLVAQGKPWPVCCATRACG